MAARRETTPLAIAACVASVVLAAPASAQRLVYTIGASHGSLDLTTGVTTPLSADEAQVGAVITSDGRIAVQSVSPSTFSVRDLTTGQQVQVATQFLPLIAHPRRLAVFGVVDQAPARLDAGGVVRWDACGPMPFGIEPQLDLSIDGATLFVLCAGTLVSLDSDTGIERRRVPMSEISLRFAVNASGTEAVGWNRSASPELVRVDLATGAVLQRRAASVAGDVMPTPARDRVIATICRIVSVDTVCTAMLVDAATLADVGWLGEASGLPAVEVSPDGRDAFVRGFGYTYATVFAQWTDVAAATIRATVSLPIDSGPLAIDYRPAPLAPLMDAPQVAAGAVALSWRLPAASPMVTGYRLEAGLAPGTTALTLPLGTAADVTIPGVPAGRYYVRIRASNVNGVSGPSNEIVVDVP